MLRARTRLSVLMLGLSAFLGGAAHAAFAPDFSDVLRTGGETTLLIRAPTALAYRNPAQNLPDDLVEQHLEGDKFFESKFSDDPDRADYGLGPVYNHVSCAACHVMDGRGSLPVLGDGSKWVKVGINGSIFLRMSSEAMAPTFNAADKWGSPYPVPGYGTQLFHLGSFGVRDDLPGTGQSEVWVKLEWSKFTYPDGSQVELKKPIFKIENPYDVMTGNRLGQADVRFGPRMTPPMIGLGLLEAIKEQDILDLAKRDLSAWGISGRPNFVFDRVKELAGDARPVSLGRFGLKANTPTIRQQAAAAMNGDIGVTNSVFPVESIWATPLFDAFKEKWKPSLEASDDITDTLIMYSQTLAVPSRRDVSDSEVRMGGRAFLKVGCANCHQPDYVTGPHTIAAVSNQKIFPFTDLLLHDMGDGLADGRRDFYADGREWRTSPLWGIGLSNVVNPRGGFLHDGRASTFEEAILWHGGEAEISRNRFAALPKAEREALIRFLRSL